MQNRSIIFLGENKTTVQRAGHQLRMKSKVLQINTGIKRYLLMDTNPPLTPFTMISFMPKPNKEVYIE